MAVCSADADCDDGDICTDDVCQAPGSCSAFCDNVIDPTNDPICDVACGANGDPCEVDADCCSNTCTGKPGSKTCK